MNMSSESLLVILFVGLVAGWLAGQIVRGTGFGIVGDIIIGILGAFVGSWLLPQLGVHRHDQRDRQRHRRRGPAAPRSPAGPRWRWMGKQLARELGPALVIDARAAASGAGETPATRMLVVTSGPEPAC